MIERRAPSRWQVIRAIMLREIGIARRQRLVRLLFLASIIPPLVLGVILIVRVTAQELGADFLDYDPVFDFLRVQIMPVALLALGLGTPAVARDRAEDVLFLYATRPVTPWSYALGKMLAVVAPTGLLLLFPGVLIAVFQAGVLGDRVSTGDTLSLIGSTVVVSALLAWSFSGVSVGPSAATKRARWALMLALVLFVFPDVVADIVTRGHAFPLAPAKSANHLLDAFLDDGGFGLGFPAAVALALHGFLGLWVTVRQVRKEMTP